MAKKSITNFVCENCGSSFASWFGKCPDCGEWNTLKQFSEPGNAPSHLGYVLERNRGLETKTNFQKLSYFSKNNSYQDRLPTGLEELDRVLGSGLVSDEVILLSGEPGVGKSTLLLSLLAKFTDKKIAVAYVSSEEAAHQVEHRCQRLNINTDLIHFSGDKNVEAVLLAIDQLLLKTKIKVLVIDSLQGMYAPASTGLPGSIAQSKEVLLRIVTFCKQHGLIGLVVGHITKEGEIAGPKFLEHMVDCVLFLEGEKTSNLRILRSFKNRFGPTEEVGFFEMTEKGMIEVKNPSEFFLEWQNKAVGKASVAVRQGVRVLFATIETLVVSTNLTFPKRVAKGIDQKRLELILAILKKYLKLNSDNVDIYVNVAGGLKINDTLADLGVAAAIFSSLTGKAFDPKHLFVGELGLLGTVRKSSALPLISKEAKRLGFSKIYSALTLSNIFQLKQI